MDEIERIQSIFKQQALPESQQTKETAETPFKETLQGFIKDVNDLQITSADAARRLVSGDLKNIHEVFRPLPHHHSFYAPDRQ